MGRLLKYIAFVFFLPIWWAQRLVPRNSEVWVFGCWYGKRYSDNSRHLFEYVQANQPQIKPIWITRDKKLVSKIKSSGGVCYLANSLKGIYYTLQAKRIIVSSGKKDVNYLFGNGAQWIQLWHGNPMKKIGLDDKFSSMHSFFQRKIVTKFLPFIAETNYDYIVSNSEIFSDKMASAFGLKSSQVLETGCPRNDIFYAKQTDAFNDALRLKFNGCKLVYYLPTFRSHEFTNSLFTLKDYKQNEFEAFLEANNMVFVSKGHFVDSSLGAQQHNNNSRLINLVDEEVSDINFMLKDADLLVTDYSGAYFDFLLTEKPIVFAAFDLEEYLSYSREMYFDYEEAVAGPIVKTWSELYRALQDIWDDKTYGTLVRQRNKFFNKYHDSNNSKRVFEALLSV